MRALLIKLVLPCLFTTIPALVGAAVIIALPAEARDDYLRRVRQSPIDWLILGLGAGLFAVQSLLALRALQWRTTSFYEGGDRWLSHLAQAAEWFPLLGLLGTVAAILQTFGAMTETITPQEIIRRYAPAITATGSGLFMALVNILPTWVVNTGRDMILLIAADGQPLSDRNR